MDIAGLRAHVPVTGSCAGPIRRVRTPAATPLRRALASSTTSGDGVHIGLVAGTVAGVDRHGPNDRDHIDRFTECLDRLRARS